MYDDAYYDVADSEGHAVSAAMEIKSPKAPPKVPKVFLSNNCAFNCAYCGCRCSHDKERYCFEPKEMARLAVQAAVKSKHGIFLTSAIYKNADYTQELILQTVKSIRRDCHYPGYVHAKVMPGADAALIRQTGLFSNRLSVNIEVAKSEGYEKIAKQKNKANILSPMGNICRYITEAKHERTPFAVSQTTQLMAGSVSEDDRTILTLSAALYEKYLLKRVYYTPFHYVHPAKGYELPTVRTPHWRMRRLYQADRLMQLYGFKADDITPSGYSFLEEDLDPKAAWALRHMEMYPVEVNKADYETLLRVPGIGTTFAARIIQARKICGLTHETLVKMKIPLKKAGHFITCGGLYRGALADDPMKMRGFLADTVKVKENENDSLDMVWDCMGI
jgi:predicted DNA-binding helix-hairpin-helix protein